METTRVTVDGIPIERWVADEIGTQARMVMAEEVRDMSKTVSSSKKPIVPPMQSTGSNGEPRTLSQEEIKSKEQKMLADQAHMLRNRIPPSETRLRNLFDVIVTAVQSDGFFSYTEHIKKDPLSFDVAVCGEREKTLKQASRYHRGRFYQDIKHLIKMGVVHFDGTARRKRTVLLGPGPKPEEERKQAVKIETRGLHLQERKLARIQLVFEISIKVRTEQ